MLGYWYSNETLVVVVVISLSLFCICIVNMVSRAWFDPPWSLRCFRHWVPKCLGMSLHCCVSAAKKKKLGFVRLFLFVGFSDSIRAMALIWLLCAFVAPFIVFYWSSLGLYKCHNMVFFGASIQQIVLFKDLVKTLFYCSNWSWILGTPHHRCNNHILLPKCLFYCFNWIWRVVGSFCLSFMFGSVSYLFESSVCLWLFLCVCVWLIGCLCPCPCLVALVQLVSIPLFRFVLVIQFFLI